jgi:hypothetical protein
MSANSTLVDTIQHKGWTIEIHVDIDPMSPLEEWDLMPYFAVWHSRHCLNSPEVGTQYDRQKKEKWYWETPEDFEDWAKDKANEVLIVMPLFMYDHSGISISTSNGSYPFNDRWDAGQCGYVFLTRERMESMWGKKKRITKKFLAKLADSIRADVKTVDDWLTGQVYGYTIRDADGIEQEDGACWGFFGYDAIKSPKGYMIVEAMGTLKYLRNVRAKEIRAERKEAYHYAQQC